RPPAASRHALRGRRRPPRDLPDARWQEGVPPGRAAARHHPRLTRKERPMVTIQNPDRHETAAERAEREEMFTIHPEIFGAAAPMPRRVEDTRGPDGDVAS